MTKVRPSILSIALGTPDEFGFSLRIDNYTGDTISLSYTGLPGNLPMTNKNFIALWQNSLIPWNKEPMKKIFIGNDDPNGSLTIDGLTVVSTSYILGYGVGDGNTSVCASSVLRVGGLVATPTNVTVGLNYIGSNALSIYYKTMAGYLPQTYHNWIGLWKGFASPYNASKAVGTTTVNLDDSEGSIAMNNVQLGVNSEYTLIYFMGKDLSTAASILYFSTGKIQSIPG